MIVPLTSDEIKIKKWRVAKKGDTSFLESDLGDSSHETKH